MSLRVREPGPATLVVDGGRPRSRSLGVPVGGAADRFALAVGNALVGNPSTAAALEISLAGPTLEAGCPLACVLFGAPFSLASDRQPLTAGKTFTLAAGEILRIGGTRAGLRAYLCVCGGVRCPTVLGSRSSLDPLRAGAEVACSPGRIHARFVTIPAAAPFSCYPFQHHGVPIALRALDGPQADWFDGEAFFGRPAEDEADASPVFTVTPASNRMGLRLQGKPLRLPDRELVSEPVCPGSVQVTRDGQCIILGVDGQTIGGYPKVAQVISADLDRLGQLRPGDRVWFRQVGLAEAEAAYRDKRTALREWVTRLRTAEVFR